MQKYRALTLHEIEELDKVKNLDKWADGNYPFMVQAAEDADGIDKNGNPYFKYTLRITIFDGDKNKLIKKTIFAESRYFWEFFYCVGRMDLYTSCTARGADLVNLMGDCTIKNVTADIKDKVTGVEKKISFIEIARFLPPSGVEKKTAPLTGKYDERNPPPYTSNPLDDEIPF